MDRKPVDVRFDFVKWQLLDFHRPEMCSANWRTRRWVRETDRSNPCGVGAHGRHAAVTWLSEQRHEEPMGMNTKLVSSPCIQLELLDMAKLCSPPLPMLQYHQWGLPHLFLWTPMNGMIAATSCPGWTPDTDTSAQLAWQPGWLMKFTVVNSG